MIMRISFREYLLSKQYLHEQAMSVPTQTLRYCVTKYCKLSVSYNGEDIDVKLKPSHVINIQWKYINNDRTPIIVTFENVPDISEDNEYDITLSDRRINNWVLSNTKVIQ